MGKVDRLRNRVEPFTVLFWSLCNKLANTWVEIFENFLRGLNTWVESSLPPAAPAEFIQLKSSATWSVKQSFFVNSGFYWAWFLSTIFPFPLCTFWTVCKFMCTFEDPGFIAWMFPFVASRIQSDWLPSYWYLPGEHWIGKFALGAFSVQSVVKRILGLVPPAPCAMP